MNYYSKYLKYKSKYMKLKNNIMEGGGRFKKNTNVKLKKDSTSLQEPNDFYVYADDEENKSYIMQVGTEKNYVVNDDDLELKSRIKEDPLKIYDDSTPDYDHIIIIPDNHGKVRLLNHIDAIKKQYPYKYSWIAIEYVLNGLESHLNVFIKALPEIITDELCYKFCKVFIYGKLIDLEKNDDFCNKLYTPNIEYTKRLLNTLRAFDFICCLEASPRPVPVEPLWVSYLPRKNNGIVLVGAAHVKKLSKLINKPTYTIFRHYSPKPAYYFIQNVLYTPQDGKVSTFA